MCAFCSFVHERCRFSSLVREEDPLLMQGGHLLLVLVNYLVCMKRNICCEGCSSGSAHTLLEPINWFCNFFAKYSVFLWKCWIDCFGLSTLSILISSKYSNACLLIYLSEWNFLTKDTTRLSLLVLKKLLVLKGFQSLLNWWGSKWPWTQSWDSWKRINKQLMILRAPKCLFGKLYLPKKKIQ